MSVDATLRKAAKLAKKGDRAGAAQLYNQVLAKFPGNTAARKGLAALGAPSGPARPGGPRANRGPGPSPQQMQTLQTLMQRGDVASVIAQGQRLALLFPKDPALLNLLGLAQSRAGKLEAAVDSFERVNKTDPAFAGAYTNKATALARLGRYDEVIKAAKAALKLNEKLPQAHLMLGYALVNTGAPEKAIAAFERAVKLAPKMPQAHMGLGNAHAALGKAKAALECFETARGLDPGSVDALNNIGNALNALGRVDEAVDALGRATELRPNVAVPHANYARALREINRSKEAIVSARKATDLEPRDASNWALLGDCLRDYGELDASREALEKATAVDPEHIIGLSQRWVYDPLPLDHPDFVRISELVEDSRVDDSKREYFELTLFNAYDKAGEPELAFPHLLRSKDIRKREKPYNLDDHLKMFDEMKAQFTDGSGPLDSGICAEIPAPHRPVFIVGMPRSGTSLVEQILASHSQVHGAGELPALAAGMARLGWREAEVGQPPDRDTLIALRKDYFTSLEKLKADSPVVTDKTPLNFRHLGHALSAMPEAKVLFMRRDARATCWSNFTRAFRGDANNFGNDMVDTARMYHAHLDFLDFWSKLFPDRITVVPYERLTEHQEEETRKLLAAVDLEWEDACLEFHKTKRAVRTASSVQVRKKMYTGSSEAWRPYEPFLGPMLEALGDTV